MRTNETAARERDMRKPPEGRSARPLACGNRQMWNSHNRVKLTARTPQGCARADCESGSVEHEADSSCLGDSAFLTIEHSLED